MEKLHFCELITLCNLLLLASVAYSKNHENPANELVDIINSNRTAQRLPHLNDSPGLGCLALQFVKECKWNCSSNGTIHCQPSEDDFTEIFAPNCGVELPTFGSISGHIVGCQSWYAKPTEAFSNVLIRDKNKLALLSNKTHTEVGVGLIGDHKGPFLWCVLFSNDRINSTFVLEDHGEGIKQNKGCFSGISAPCSGGQITNVFLNNILIMLFSYIYILEQFSFNFFKTI